jgi:hypothetical protein
VDAAERLRYAEALRREREFVIATAGKDDRHVAEIDAELRRVEGPPRGRRRPPRETA